MMEASIADNIVLPSLVERSQRLRAAGSSAAALGEAARDMAERVRVNAKAIDRDGGADPVRRQPAEGRDRASGCCARPRSSSSTSRRAASTSAPNTRSTRSSTSWSPTAPAILFISSEIEELIGMADRIMVMGRGEVRGFFDRAQLRPRGADARGAVGLRKAP